MAGEIRRQDDDPRDNIRLPYWWPMGWSDWLIVVLALMFVAVAVTADWWVPALPAGGR